MLTDLRGSGCEGEVQNNANFWIVSLYIYIMLYFIYISNACVTVKVFILGTVYISVRLYIV